MVMKRVFGVLICVVMVFSICIPAFAQGTNTVRSRYGQSGNNSYDWNWNWNRYRDRDRDRDNEELSF